MGVPTEFRSIYRHGFARVAACTTRCTLADPAANAAAILEVARACHTARRGAGGVPGTRRLGLRDQRSAAPGRAARCGGGGCRCNSWRRRRTCCRCCWSARRCAMPARCTTARSRSIAAGCSAWCRRCICRTTASSTSRGISWRATAWWAARSPSAALTAPFGTDLLFAAEDVPGLVVHAEICEDVWIPIPPSSQAALAGATVLANLSASNITIGKAETRRLLCASQSARCVAAYLYAAAGAGESTTDLAWDGQASIFENGATLAETERFPSASQFALADIDLDLLRHERMQMGSFDTNRRRNPDDLPPHRVPAGSAARRYRPGAQGRALSVRAGRSGAAGAGLLRGLQHPGLGPGAAAARDRHQAGGDRRVGRARFHPGADRVRAGARSARSCRAATSSPTRCRASPPRRTPRPMRSV